MAAHTFSRRLLRVGNSRSSRRSLFLDPWASSAGQRTSTTACVSGGASMMSALRSRARPCTARAAAEFVGVLLPEDDPSSSCKLMPCASAMSPYLFNATSGGSGPPPAAHHFPRFSTVRAHAAQAERNRTDHESIRFRRFRETHVNQRRRCVACLREGRDTTASFGPLHGIRMRCAMHRISDDVNLTSLSFAHWAVRRTRRDGRSWDVCTSSWMMITNERIQQLQRMRSRRRRLSSRRRRMTKRA